MTQQYNQYNLYNMMQYSFFFSFNLRPKLFFLLESVKTTAAPYYSSLHSHHFDSTFFVWPVALRNHIKQNLFEMFIKQELDPTLKTAIKLH